jgi:antitoxin component of MazEF toxin-antitoxin module
MGKSLALRIPQSVVKDARLAEGDRLALDISPDGSIVLRLAPLLGYSPFAQTSQSVTHFSSTT